MRDMVGSVKSFVVSRGFLYIDYMLPLEKKYAGRDNYPGREAWAEYFSDTAWQVISHRVLKPQFEAAHVDLPVDHEHHWGHLLARRR
jgi:hypothetical protein